METDDYYEITSQLDAREILRYLNNLGIHNINGEILKYFITDLKKLIKYDLQHKNENLSTKEINECGPERLHSASTFSSRLRSRRPTSELCCSKDCQKTKIIYGVRNIHSAPTIGVKKTEQIESKRACSCIRIEKRSETLPKDMKTMPSLSNNLIKIPKQSVKRKCDPVSLYHYYTSLWAKYKPNVPGENNWSELRWSIRQKMAGSGASHFSKTSNVIGKPAMETKKLKVMIN